MLDSSIFKAYDIRGIYPSQFNEEAAYDIGRAYLDFIREEEKIAEPQIVIGRDARLSSDKIFKALAKGITDQGGDIFDIGYATTPMLYFGVNFLTAHGGIMITASHNPAQYNGLKMDRELAIPIGANSGLKTIQKKIENQDFKRGETKEAILKKEIIPYYVDFLTKNAKVNIKDKIIIDAGNGMTPLILPHVLEKLKVHYVPLYFDIDCTFPNHEANPLKEETLDKLKEVVKKHKALLGIAFDGDGDRVVFVTEKGEVIRGDYLTGILAQDILKEHEGGKVVYGLRCSRSVKETIENAGGQSIVSPVGYAHIRRIMKENKAIFGGELSSHIYYSFNFPLGTSYFESGIYAMVKFLEILSKTNKKPSALLNLLKKYPNSGEINFEIENKEEMIEKIENIYGKEGRVEKIDGLTVEIKKGKEWFWFNVRPSNTEPLLRMILEASNEKLFKEELKEIKNLIIKGGRKHT